MKRTILVLSVFAVQMMFTPAFAADPPGSYRLSCKNIRQSARDLVANCKKMSGRYVSTTLPDYTSCRTGKIDNVDGQLFCERR